MTVGINRLNQMFRDFKVAEDVGKMMELRRFEVEFEVFGTVYWQNGERHYLVSKNENTLYRQMQPLALEDSYPLAMQTWHESTLVPAGWDEEIEQSVKVHFCKILRARFPETFWKNINIVTSNIVDDSATKILDPLQEQLDGLFQDDLLQLFEGILTRVYLRKNLTKRSYNMYQAWLKEVRQEMIDDVAIKDLFSRDLYGFAYQNESGHIQYYLNASQRLMFEKQEKQLKLGHLVSPVFHKKFWYNYDYRLDQVRSDFKILLQKLYNESYFGLLRQIDLLDVAVNCEAYHSILKDYGDNEMLAEAWKNLGFQWGIYSTSY